MVVVKRKKKVQRMARRTNIESGISFENFEKMTPEEFSRKRSNAQQYYYQEWTGKALVDYVFTWMKAHNYTNAQIEAAKSAKGLASIPENIGAWCKILDDGCPDYNASYSTYIESLPGITSKVLRITEHIEKVIAQAIAASPKIAKEKTSDKKQIPNIQQRVKASLAEYCGDIDGWLDTWVINPRTFGKTEFDVLRNLQEKDTTAFYASQIIAAYSRDFAEINEVISLRKTETVDDLELQLLESYDNHTTASLVKLQKAHQSIVDACNVIKAKKKIDRKPRKAKPVNIQKLADKIKYMKSFDALKLVSVNPLDIIGASEVWVYNTKYRLLGHYFANDMQSLAIKGTTIQNFNEMKSVEKKIRNPEEQLRDFKAAGKVALKKFLDEIRAKPVALRGRINKDTIIMRIIQ